MSDRKLLLVNKFYHDKGPAGGVGRYLVQEEEDLLKAGWDVVPFAMADADARPSPWSRFFVRARDYSAPRFNAEAIGDAVSLVWNREAAANLESLLKETRPTVAHLHNIYHHLSPSILPVLRRHNIPVVMTLHDLRLLCPAIHMLRDGHAARWRSLRKMPGRSAAQRRPVQVRQGFARGLDAGRRGNTAPAVATSL